MSDNLAIPSQPASQPQSSSASISSGSLKNKRGGLGALKKSQPKENELSAKSDELGKKALSPLPLDSPKIKTEKDDRAFTQVAPHQIIEDISTPIARVANIGESILSPENNPQPPKPAVSPTQKDAAKETPAQMAARGHREFELLRNELFAKARPNWTNAVVTKETAAAKLAQGKIGDFVAGFSPLKKSKNDLILYMNVPDGKDGIKLQETIIPAWKTDTGTPTGYFHYKGVGSARKGSAEETTLDDIIKDYRNEGGGMLKQHEEDKMLLSMHVASQPTSQAQISNFMIPQKAGTFFISRLESSGPDSANKLQISVKLDENRLLAYTIQPSGSDYVFLKCQILDKHGKPNDAGVLTPRNKFEGLDFKLDISSETVKAKLSDIIDGLENFRDKH